MPPSNFLLFPVLPLGDGERLEELLCITTLQRDADDSTAQPNGSDSAPRGLEDVPLTYVVRIVHCRTCEGNEADVTAPSSSSLNVTTALQIAATSAAMCV